MPRLQPHFQAQRKNRIIDWDGDRALAPRAYCDRRPNLMQTATLLMLGLILSHPASSQEPVEQLTVTASRLPMATHESGAALTVLYRDDIRAQGAQTLADLLLGLPGISVSRQGPSGALTQIRMRGAEANHVLVLIDGVEANDVTQGGEFNFAHFPIHQIERIEIVRGPQSAIWGSDALAGVIHIVTLTPEETLNRLEMSASYGNHDSGEWHGQFLKSNDRHRIDLSASISQSDGENISRTGSEKDGERHTAARISTRSRLNDQWTVNLQARRSADQVDFDAIDWFSTGLPTDADNESESQFWFASGALRHSPNDRFEQSLTFDTSKTKHRNQDQNYGLTKTSGEKRKIHWIGQYEIEAHGLLASIEDEADRFELSAPVDFFGDPNQARQIRQRSVTLEYLFRGQAMLMGLSARRDHNSAFGHVMSYQWQSSFDLPTLPLRLSAAVGQGIKNPSFVERFGYYDSFVGNPALNPETSRSWDLGLAYREDDSPFQISVHLYGANLEDEINGFSFSPELNAFTAKNESGSSRRRGVELEGSFTQSQHLTWHWGYQYAKSVSPSGEIELRRPRHSGQVRMNLNFDRWNLSMAVKRTGEQRDLYFPPSPPYQLEVALPGFTVASLAGSFRLHPDWEIFLRTDNLLDHAFEEVFGYKAPGRKVSAGIRWVR